MGIFGVGTDIIDIRRIEAALGRFGIRFARRILCEPEMRRFESHRKPAAYLAKRFAAKEAFTKALGTGIGFPANWHGVWIVNKGSGQPVLQYTLALQLLMRSRGAGKAHVSITDERDVACATVILESSE